MSSNLHERALEAAKRFKQAESDLVGIFQELDETKEFARRGCSSLFVYGVKVLGLSEANTYAFIQVARKSFEVPALKSAMENGTLTLSKATRISSVINPQNQESWLEKAQTVSKAALEKEIAHFNPEKAVVERARYVTSQRMELKVGVSEKLMKKLKRAQDLVSQRTRKAANLEQSLDEMAEVFLDKHDPVRKVSRAKFQLCSGRVFRAGRSRIPAPTRHALNARDGGQCTYVYPDGTRCEQERWLEIHHKKPVSEGGTNALANLETRCFQHHRFAHQRESG